MPIAIALGLVSAACGGGADPSTMVVGSTGTADGGTLTGFVVPVPSGMIIDEDPDSPIAVTLTFDAGDYPIDRIDYLGPKPPTNRPPTAALIYLKGREDILQIDLDATGQPSVMHLGDVGELQFDIEGSTLTVEYVAPDGSISAESFALTGESNSVEAMPNPS
ncbi:MAG: hypothetical protein M3094_07930 [Actinomycetia bacterium]|nr:hypothetical protein [Actinomycetes bacterium]